MKTILTAATLAITLAATGATATAHERCRDDDRSYGYRGGEVVRYDAPEVYYDRYGNRVVVTRERRCVIPVEDHCRRPVVIVPECHRAPVCEERHEYRSHHEPHFVGALKFIFGR